MRRSSATRLEVVVETTEPATLDPSGNTITPPRELAPLPSPGRPPAGEPVQSMPSTAWGEAALVRS